MLTTQITDNDWRIEAQVREHVANGETPEVARELADTQEAWLINNAYGRLPKGWYYEGDGVWAGPSPITGAPADAATVILGLQIEAVDYALQAQALETLAQ